MSMIPARNVVIDRDHQILHECTDALCELRCHSTAALWADHLDQDDPLRAHALAHGIHQAYAATLITDDGTTSAGWMVSTAPWQVSRDEVNVIWRQTADWIVMAGQTESGIKMRRRRRGHEASGYDTSGVRGGWEDLLTHPWVTEDA